MCFLAVKFYRASYGMQDAGERWNHSVAVVCLLVQMQLIRIFDLHFAGGISYERKHHDDTAVPQPG